ncbi:MAG TPA: DinB family protein [Longimicrobiales bacterium]|nr:DinB family protein [Longimicrobiales bacterium]
MNAEHDPPVPELTDLVEHLERYRATTLQVFELLEEGDLAWRPDPDQYSLGQQLLHIAQAEDRWTQGLFEGDWSYDRVRFPEELPDAPGMLTFFREVRRRLLDRIQGLSADDLGVRIDVPDAPARYSLRWYLWFLLEHELHHRGQVWAYLRAMGKTPPFYAAPLPLGERPDHQAREELGGF